MLVVLLLKVAHQLFPLGQIRFQCPHNFFGHDSYLIISRVTPGNRASAGIKWVPH